MILFCVQDSSVIQLTQDLAKILGLKIRKAYVRTKVHTPPTHIGMMTPTLVILGVFSVYESVGIHRIKNESRYVMLELCPPQPALNVLQTSSYQDASCDKVRNSFSIVC